MHPSVAVVILNFNGVHHLRQFLPSVLASTYNNLQVIVADNGSTDDSVAMLQQNFPTVQVIHQNKNEGYAGGYNWALQLVVADYYVLLNSDVEVQKDWIEPIIDLMESDPMIGACQPKLLSYTNKNSFEYAGASGGWIDYLGYPFSRGRIFDVLENDNGQYNDSQPIFWASGAALFIRSRVFHEMNGFDTSFFAHQEEIDLCWRMQLAGYKIYVCPSSIVFHVGAGTLPRGGRKVFLNFRNNLLMMGKNLPLQEKLWKIPLRFSLDGISAWKGLFAGDAAFFTAIVKAHWVVIMKWLFGKTKQTVKTKPMHTLTGVYSKSLVWKHFILKQTKYNEISRKPK